MAKSSKSIFTLCMRLLGFHFLCIAIALFLLTSSGSFELLWVNCIAYIVVLYLYLTTLYSYAAKIGERDYANDCMMQSHYERDGKGQLPEAGKRYTTKKAVLATIFSALPFFLIAVAGAAGYLAATDADYRALFDIVSRIIALPVSGIVNLLPQISPFGQIISTFVFPAVVYFAYTRGSKIYLRNIAGAQAKARAVQKGKM